MTTGALPGSPATDAGIPGRFRAGRWWRGPLAIARGPAEEPAADRVLRRLGLSVGVAGVIVAVVELPEIAGQSHGLEPGGVALTVALAFGLFPVLAVVSLGMNRRVIQATAAAAALSFLGAAVVLPVVHGDHEAVHSPVWLYRVAVLGVLVAALAWRPIMAVGYLAFACVLVSAANASVVSETSVGSFLTAVARSAGLALLFLWCVVYARAAAARLDRESVLESSRAAAVAGAAARERERARFAALIHDAVLSTLFDAYRGSSPPEALSAQARRTLEQLAALRGGGTGPDRLDARSAVGFLRAAVHEVDPEIAVTVRCGKDDDDLDMPLEAAVTLAAALAEAARNSLRHAGVAGRAVRRSAVVTTGAGGLSVVLRDDGAGFDPGAVPPDRLGIGVSILGRMRRLPGGAGFVESQPGQGTAVTLMWGNDG